MDLNIENAELKYKELGTLTKVSEFFDVSLESLRQFFIENNLLYKKRGKYECNDSFFSIPSEKSFYWAGFIAADGNVEKGSNRIKIELKSTLTKEILVKSYEKEKSIRGVARDLSIERTSAKRYLKKYNII